jgi:thiamine-monophosphate kinase
MVSITAFGRAPRGAMVHRAGAKPGDHIMVTGTIGDSTLGLDILKGGAAATALAGDSVARDYLIGRYRVPQPRNALALALRDYASSAMDISDGLAGDLAKLCAASGVSAVIDAPRIPLSLFASAVLARGVLGIERLVSGGDDYEILCTVPETRADSFAQAAQRTGVALTAIGQVIAGTGAPRFLDARGEEIALTRLSYSHF